MHSVRDAALAWQGPTITWVGPESDLPVRYAGMSGYDAIGRLVVPGLINCHTHLAFGACRAQQFKQLLEGMTYREIAGAGGGIMRTAVIGAEGVDHWLYHFRAIGLAGSRPQSPLSSIELSPGPSALGELPAALEPPTARGSSAG